MRAGCFSRYDPQSRPAEKPPQAFIGWLGGAPARHECQADRIQPLLVAVTVVMKLARRSG